ncbi:MAG TPA: Gfo/Idh/MocA family oxidoreductase [Paenirhodobacter sp.]
MVYLAIIGMGRWGQVLVNSVQGRSDQVRFVVGATRTPARAEAFAARQGIEILPDLAAVLARTDVDGIVLATPHSEHAAQIAAATAAGKAVFCEKPLALTLDQGRTAFDNAEAAGVALCVGHNRRFLPSFHRMIAQLAEIGPVLQMIGNFSGAAQSYAAGGWRTSLDESPAGGMTGLGIHMIDAMIAAGLRPETVTVARRGLDGPQTAVTALIDAGPSIGVLTTMQGPGRAWRLELHGSNGRMAMDGEQRLVVQKSGAPEEIIDFGATDTERAELEAFAAVIRGTIDWPVTRDEALRGLALFEAICQGAIHAPGTQIDIY